MRKNAEKKTSSDVPRGRVTIRMVADRAGVSSAAVYAVLNRNPRSNIGVSEEKRKTIQKVIAELGYIPNNSARMLVYKEERGLRRADGVDLGQLWTETGLLKSRGN